MKNLNPDEKRTLAATKELASYVGIGEWGITKGGNVEAEFVFGFTWEGRTYTAQVTADVLDEDE